MSRLALKPGVVFKTTTLGGLLLDVSGDRFLALRPLGARLWQRGVADGSRDSLLSELGGLDLGLDAEVAQSLVDHQLEQWRAVGLLDASGSDPLPISKSSPLVSARREFKPRGRLSVRAAVRLIHSEITYRRLLHRRGLAAALVRLQQRFMSQPLSRDLENLVSRILVTYQALRLLHRQGESAKDCLIRSLSLAAVLRESGIDADLCIGVREMPFSSHAWVEWRECILNETQAKIVTYAPMARF